MTTYYVDTSADGDVGAGTSEAANIAWKTITKVNASSFSAGDSILFKRGCTWREQLTIPSSGSVGNPITYGAYGSGDLPKIYGSTAITSWTYENYEPPTTITQVQAAKNGVTTSASVTVSWNITPTAGNLLIAFGRGGSADSNASISGWTKAVGNQCTTTVYQAIFYKIAGVGEGDVTLAWTSSTSTRLTIMEYSGIVTTSPLDKTAYTATTGSTVTSRSSGTTAATTVASELCMAFFITGDVISANSYSNSFTEEANQGDIFFVASKIVSSMGVQETTMSWTTARLAGGCIATFKAVSYDAKSLYKVACATDPQSVWFVCTDGITRWGEKQASKDALSSEYDWWFDDPNNLLYVYTATDPDARYTSIETPTRDYCTYANGKNYIIIQNIEAAFSQTVNADSYGAIFFNNSTSPIVEYCKAHHTGVLAADPNGNGIFFGDCNAPTARYNEAYSCARRGIVVFHYSNGKTVDDALIEYNEVYNSYHSGIDVFRSGDVTGTLNNPIIRYNNIYFDENYGQGYSPILSTHGIAVAGSLAASDYRVTNVIIAYNVIKNVYQDQAIQIIRKVNGAVIANNTGYGCLTGSTTGTGIQVAGSLLNTNIVVKNNIMMDYKSYCFYAPELEAVTSADNNLWYQPDGGIAVYVSVGGSSYHYNDQATYKSVTGFDTYGLWENPDLVSLTDFHLALGSPCHDTGISIVGIHDQADNIDFGGAKSPQRTNPSIGAYEYIRKVIWGRIML